MKRFNLTCSALFLTLSACGGGNEAAAPPAAPTAASTPATPKTAEPAPTPPPAPKPTMAELQQKFVANENALFNAHDAQKYAELHSEDAVTVMPGPAGLEETRGRQAIAKSFADLFAAFPDIKSTNVRVLSKDNVVVEQWVCTGTQKGDFNGMKASGKPMGINGISIVWLNDDGLVTHADTYLDPATIASQEGLSKAPARPIAVAPTEKAEWIAATGSDTEKKNEGIPGELLGSFAKKDIKTFLSLHTEKTVYSDFAQPKDIVGLAGAKALFNQFSTAFPDLVASPSNVWGIGDYVVFEANITGTQKGKLGPIKPTKKAVSTHMASVAMVKDGKLERGWGYSSNIEMLGQLGLLTPPPAAKK